MSIYVIIGFNFNFDISTTENDYPFIDKIYILGSPENPGTFDNDKIEYITDQNALDFYITKEFNSLDKDIVFIDCIGENKSYLDVMYFLDTVRFDRRSYYTFNPKNKTLVLKDYPLVQHFNPFQGDEVPATLGKEDKKAIQEFFINMISIIKAYLNAGFHLKEINSTPDSWMMNVATPELHFMIHYYEIYPLAPDLAISLEFLHNSQYRQIITKTMVHVAANYLVRNGFINPNQTIDWYNPSTYDLKK